MDTIFAQDQDTGFIGASVELETTILATVIQYPEAYRHFTHIEPWQFTHPELRSIWKTIRKLATNSARWSVVSINIETEKRYQHTLSILASDLTSLDPKGDAKRLTDYAMRRAMVKSAQEVLKAAEEGKNSAEMAAISRRTSEHVIASGEDFITGSGAAELIIGDMARNTRPRSTGIPQLDAVMEGGMYPGEMYVLGGRKKTGKTMFGGTLSYNLSQQGAKHLYVAAEMGAKRIHQRVMARQLGVHQSNFRPTSPNFDQTMHDVAYHRTRMGDSVFYCNAPGITLDRLKQVIATAVLKHGIEGVIVDYWQIIGGRGRMDERQHLDHVAQEIANISEHFNIWNWTLSQINNDGNTRGGEGIRNACTMMLEMHRPKKNEPWVWFEMKETRNTEWVDIGEKGRESIIIDGNGPFIRAATEDELTDRPAPLTNDDDETPKPKRKRAPKKGKFTDNQIPSGEEDF